MEQLLLAALGIFLLLGIVYMTAKENARAKFEQEAVDADAGFFDTKTKKFKWNKPGK